MNRAIQTIALLLLSIFLFSQEQHSYYPLNNNLNPFYTNAGIGSYNALEQAPELKKPDADVTFGTSFSTDLKRGYSFSTFAAPEIKYRTSKRFTIRGGISLVNTEYHNSMIYSPAGIGIYSGNITQGMIYISGDYMLSPRLFLSGTAYKEFSIDHSSSGNILNPAFEGKGLMMNVRFIPSDHVTIDAGVEFYQGNNPYRSMYNNPFYRPFAPTW